MRWLDDKSAKNHINCSEMLNAFQERKRSNRLVIIPWQNTIPFQKLIGDHFGVDMKRKGDHFGVNLEIISGLGIILGAVQNIQILSSYFPLLLLWSIIIVNRVINFALHINFCYIMSLILENLY